MTTRKDEPPAAHLCYTYRRCSHESSRESGLGLEVQSDQLKAYFDLQAALKYPGLQLVEVPFDDLAVSGWKYDFLARNGGSALNAMLKPGDHIIFPELKTAFRNLRDCLNTLKFWGDQGIIVHFVDLQIDLGTALGRFVLHTWGAVGELHSALTSERNKATAARLIRQGRATGGSIPLGRKRVGKGKDKHLEWDNEVRAIMQHIVRLRDNDGLSFEKISDVIEERVAKAEGRSPLSPARRDRQWKRQKCQKAYEREKQYQEERV